MNLINELLYQAQVNIIGKAALRMERLRLTYKHRRAKPQKHANVNPPLGPSPWLKELISTHYLIGQHANRARKVAWVTSGAPIEYLKALGFVLIYPENHAAVCGIRHLGDRQCESAEQAGYSRDLCSYFRTDMGTLLSGQTPVGRLPRPDLLVCCNNICQTVLGWYQVLAHTFQVPLVLIDTPFLYEEAREHDVNFVERQIDAAIEQAERVAGESLRQSKLARVMELSLEAVALWLKILEYGRHRPSPILAFDEFIHMAPIVEMRGDMTTVKYYRALLAAVQQRVARGTGALIKERRRLVWDNLPIWYRMRALSDLMARNQVALVASTYTNAWGELARLIDPQKPLASMARCYLHVILNRTSAYKLSVIQKLVREYQADGVLLHSDRSCKPYSIGQIDQQNRLNQTLGVPALIIQADHNDSRSYTEEQTENRLAAFFEMLST